MTTVSPVRVLIFPLFTQFEASSDKECFACILPILLLTFQLEKRLLCDMLIIPSLVSAILFKNSDKLILLLPLFVLEALINCELVKHFTLQGFLSWSTDVLMVIAENLLRW